MSQAEQLVIGYADSRKGDIFKIKEWKEECRARPKQLRKNWLGLRLGATEPVAALPAK